jgi:flagella basal body P-ring formation protein FlgA
MKPVYSRIPNFVRFEQAAASTAPKVSERGLGALQKKYAAMQVRITAGDVLTKDDVKEFLIYLFLIPNVDVGKYKTMIDKVDKKAIPERSTAKSSVVGKSGGADSKAISDALAMFS